MERTVRLIWSDIKEPFLESVKDFWLFLKALISFEPMVSKHTEIFKLFIFNYSYIKINQANGHFDLETYE